MSFLKELIKSEDSVKQFENEFFQNIVGKKTPFKFGGLIEEKKNEKIKVESKKKNRNLKKTNTHTNYLYSGFGAILFK